MSKRYILSFLEVKDPGVWALLQNGQDGGESSSSGIGMVHPCEVIVLCSFCRCVLGPLLGIASRMSLHDFILFFLSY